MIKHIHKIAIAVSIFCANMNSIAADGPPSLMTYQGHLVDALGQPVGADQPTAKTIQFRIYTAETGGEVKYAEEQTVTVDKGYFSVLLGQGSAIPGEPGPPNTPFASTIFDDDENGVFDGNKSDQRFIGIRVDGIDINPRLRYVASPYAVLSQKAVEANRSQTVATISGHKADDSLHADKATLAKAVESIKGHKADSAVIADRAKVADGVSNGSIPIGGIIMWTKNSIPTGWRLCNGSGGTPNLVNRFVVGAGHWYGIRGTGGVNSVALHYNHMPRHSHSAGAHGGGNHWHRIYTRQDDWNDSGGHGPSWGNGDNGHYRGYHGTHWGGHHGHHIYTHNAGHSHHHENRPPWYAVYYIMRVK